MKRVSAVLIAIVMITIGCAPKQEVSKWDPYKLVWPLPPEKPRIKYYDSLKSEEDVKPKRSISETIFGALPRAILRKPYGVTTDEEGRVYVSDVGRIFVFDKKNHKLTFIGDRGVGKLIRPLGMFYDKTTKRLYVADSYLDRVMVYDTRTGRAVLEIGQKGRGNLKDPGGVAVDTVRDRVYVTNTKRHVISVFNTEGEFIGDIGRRGEGEGEFNFPTQITVDKEGNIYVVDTGNFRVQVLSPEGKFLRKMGSIGVRFGQFARPKGIAIDPDGHIYVTDAMFHGVTIFDKDGTLLLTWGSRGWERGLFDLPAAIHIDERGLIYVVSQWTGRVDIFQYISYPEEKAGSKKPER